MAIKIGNRMKATEQAHMTKLIELVGTSNCKELRELFWEKPLRRSKPAMDSATSEDLAIEMANRKYKKTV